MERCIQHADRRRGDVSVAIPSTHVHLVAVASHRICRWRGLFVVLSLVINLYRLVDKIHHFEIWRDSTLSESASALCGDDSWRIYHRFDMDDYRYVYGDWIFCLAGVMDYKNDEKASSTN